MAPSSANGDQPRDPQEDPRAESGPCTAAEASSGPEPGGDPAAISNAELLELLGADRLWLLQQIDAGRWPELRLDLAALERELGQLLDQAAERLPRP